MTAILTFTAELAAWVLIAAGLGVIGIAVAAAWMGLVVDRHAGDRDDWLPATNALHHSLRNHGEGDGVGELGVGQVHGQSNYNNLGAE